MYENDGEKYFVFDSHLHFWDASPANWVKARRSTQKAGSSASTPTRAWARPETHWPIENFQKYSLDDFEKDVFTEGTSTWRCSSPRT